MHLCVQPVTETAYARVRQEKHAAKNNHNDRKYAEAESNLLARREIAGGQLRVISYLQYASDCLSIRRALVFCRDLAHAFMRRCIQHKVSRALVARLTAVPLLHKTVTRAAGANATAMS